MKLLSKPAINQAKALERSIEISEGKKLAEKVDELRRLKSNEEANLKKFREETVAQIRAEIDAEINKRTALKTENSWLEEVRAKLKTPVDLKEKELFERETAVFKREEAASATRAEHLGKLREIADARLALKSETDLIERGKKDAVKVLKEALEHEKEARAKVRDAGSLYLNATNRSNQISEALLNRELDIASRERDLQIRNEHLDRVQDALNRRERVIIDREETLARELKRIIQ